MTEQQRRYFEWVRAEALKIKSDGCTHAVELGRPCCWEHDLAFHYGRDPRHAYVIWASTHSDPWKVADTIGFVEANNRFAGCLPWWLRYRWLGVMAGGWGIWKRARAKDGGQSAPA